MASSIGFWILSFLSSCYSSYGAWTFTPVGLSPTVHASLRWTHTYRDSSVCALPRSLPSGCDRSPMTYQKPVSGEPGAETVAYSHRVICGFPRRARVCSDQTYVAESDQQASRVTGTA